MARKPSRVDTTPNPNGNGWVNRVDGRAQPTVHRTQRTAAERGAEIARKREAEHFIHRPNGQIRERNSYGGDPFPPAG